eukprot:gene17437-19182_t
MDQVTNKSNNFEINKTQDESGSLQFLDLTGIHWGYLNCWQSVARSKKVKVDKWFTYWVDLCGGTMRLYKDKSLPPDSVNMPPSSSVTGPSPENEQKFAFFGLKDATVDLVSDLNIYPKKLKPVDFTRVFRRHLFQLVFTKLNSTYVFQAPSNSSMLRWVSKIQEAIAITQNEQAASAATDEQIKLANFMLQQRRLNTTDTIKSKKQDTVDLTEVEDEEIKRTSVQNTESTRDPKLVKLQESLKEKKALYDQLCLQEERFLGGETEQEVCGDEVVGTAAQDYYLIPGRIDTFICKGTKMTLFGQLPNKRWRCWIEINDVIQSMNNLITETEHNKRDEKDQNDSNEAIKSSLFDQNKQTFQTTSEKDLSTRRYPIIGAIPASIVKEFNEANNVELDPVTQEKDDGLFMVETPPSISPSEVPEINDESDQDKEVLTAVPYSSHARRSTRKTNSQLSIDSFFFIPKDTDNGNKFANQNQSPIEQRKLSGSFPSLQSSSSSCKEDIRVRFSENAEIADVSDHSVDTKSPETSVGNTSYLSPDNNPNAGVRLRENGFIIKKRLRQKGISIIIGSSSSEDEDSEEEKADERTSKNIEDQLFSPVASEVQERISESKRKPRLSATREFFAEDEDVIKEGGRSSRSSCTLPGKLTANTDLLQQFGLRSASIGNSDADRLFPKFKGPDVKPPRNERRTLKLSKHPDKGFGFYLQTFVFTKSNGGKDRKTFVRYVEEEGPAYMSGLREGDVIVEVDGEEVNNKDHAELVNMIKNSKRELLLVVKFIDALKRADLCIKIKKKKAKLRSRVREYEELLGRENDLQQLSLDEMNSMKRSDSTTSSGIGLSDDSSDNITSSDEQVIIQTSCFEERSPLVFDSVKEIRYADDSNNNNNNARTHITTTFDLLNDFSTELSLKEERKSKAVHRSRSFSGSFSKKEQDKSSPKDDERSSKDDGFITGVPSLTKSRPPAKIVSNRNSFSTADNPQNFQSTKPLDNHERIFHNPASNHPSATRTRSALPTAAKKDRLSSLPPKDYTPGKSATLSNPARDRNILSRNSRPKSYKIAVTSGSGANKKYVERIVSYDQIRSRSPPPETDL